MQDSCCGDKKETGCCSSTLNCAGRWLFAVPMFIFGVFHFIAGGSMVGALAGWPFALFFVYLSGAGLIFGAVAIVLNRYARLAATLLAIEIGLFILILHLPTVLAGGEGMQMALMGALKDLALVGGALVIASHMMNRGFSAK
ncbi:MAG: DoxX family protein [Patescibacteria group bacterium]